MIHAPDLAQQTVAREAVHGTIPTMDLDSILDLFRPQDRSAERQCLVEEHGGLAAGPRVWRGCDNRALLDTPVCVEHTHPEPEHPARGILSEIESLEPSRALEAANLLLMALESGSASEIDAGSLEELRNLTRRAGGDEAS